MKVVLVGYMGSGKTTTGKLLAESLAIPFIDLDHYISEKYEMSVTDLFKTKGAVFFSERQSEKPLFIWEILRTHLFCLQEGEPLVLATIWKR